MGWRVHVTQCQRDVCRSVRPTQAHTRALELELDMLPQGQQARPHESPQALGNTAGPGRLQMPADARQVDSDGAVSSSCTADGGPPLHLPSSGGGGGGTGEEVRGQAAAFNAQQTGTSSSRNGGGDSGGGAPGHGRAAALGHLASLTRQQRKLWASATFQVGNLTGYVMQAGTKCFVFSRTVMS